MKLTYLRRRGGKTTKAIAECRKTGAILVVPNPAMRRRLVDDGVLPQYQIATFKEVSGFGGTFLNSPEFIIDDADLILRALIPIGTIRRITMSRPFTKAECKKFGYSSDMMGKA